MSGWLGWMLAVAALQEAPGPAELAWTLELVTDPELSVRFTLETSGDPDGRSELQVTQGWGGVAEAGVDLDGLVVRDAAGARLEVVREQPHRWLVEHAPGARLHVEYRLRPNSNQDDADPRVHYRPILTERGLHAIGELVLLRPAHLDDQPVRRQSVEWVGFAQAGWEVASSLGPGEDRRSVELPLYQVRQSLFVAGQIELFEREIRERPLIVAVAGGDWGFDPELFADLCTDVVALERGFFQHFDRPPYLISLLPVGAPDPQQQSLGGTGLFRSFATFTRPGISLAPGALMREQVLLLLVHEMFHEWNGHVIRRESPEERMYWFSEGFTSFFTRRLALRGGWIDAAGYVENLNGVIREYHTSPERNADAARIEEAFWSDGLVQRQPYVRGDLLAALVDFAIRTRSGGERSLDDLMRSWVDAARATHEGTLELSNGELLAALGEWTDERTAEHVRRVALEGATLELPADLFAPALVSERREVSGYDPGFALERSQADGFVRGVRVGSAAWRAGLRDGQELRGVSVWKGRTDLDAVLQVVDEAGERSLRYRPLGEALKVPHFSLRAEPGSAALEIL